MIVKKRIRGNGLKDAEGALPQPAAPAIRQADLVPAIIGSVHSDFQAFMDGKYGDVFGSRSATHIHLLFDHYSFFPKILIINFPG